MPVIGLAWLRYSPRCRHFNFTAPEYDSFCHAILKLVSSRFTGFMGFTGFYGGFLWSNVLYGELE